MTVNLKWEGAKHFLEWAQWLAKQRDDEYDPDVDPEPRVWLAHQLCDRPETAACCLLNCDGRAACPSAAGWEEALEFVRTAPPGPAGFEAAAERFLDLAARRHDWKRVRLSESKFFADVGVGAEVGEADRAGELGAPG